MPTAASIIAKVSRALTQVGPMARTSYFRVTTVTGGDTLTGVGLTIETADTEYSPQPFYKQLNKHEAMYLSGGSLQLVADDYKFIFPVGQATKAMFQATNIQLILKDQNGYEGLKIIYIDSPMFGGSDVAITVFARSVGFYPPPSVLSGVQVMLQNGAYVVLQNGNNLVLE